MLKPPRGVVNIHYLSQGWDKDNEYVYIGGGKRGRFGNPIVRGKTCPVCGLTHHTAGSTLPCYKKWLWKQHLDQTPLIKSIVRELGDKWLVCWCKPNPCHGDIITAYIKWLIEQLNAQGE